MKNVQSNKVSTLWLKGRIRNIDHVCLASMVANNLDVTLYHYEPITNLPKGVKLADACEILDLSLLDRLHIQELIIHFRGCQKSWILEKRRTFLKPV